MSADNWTWRYKLQYLKDNIWGQQWWNDAGETISVNGGSITIGVYSYTGNRERTTSFSSWTGSGTRELTGLGLDITNSGVRVKRIHYLSNNGATVSCNNGGSWKLTFSFTGRDYAWTNPDPVLE